MANFFSDQYVSFLQAIPVVKLQPSDLAGRVRVARFTFTGPASGQPGIGDSIFLSALPWKARVLAVFLGNDAEGAGTTLAFGDGVTSGRWGTSAALTAAGANWIFPTKSDFQTAAPTTIPSSASGAAIQAPNMVPFLAVVGVAATAASASIYGYALYVVD